MTRPLVSVVMNCYNGERYLAEAIDSVLNQTYANWELVFFDNASTDKSPGIVSNYTDKRIRYFRSQQNTPLGMARNAALAVSQGRYITFLDTDDRWLPEKLQVQVSLMLNQEDVGLTYSNYYKIIGSKKILGLHGAQATEDTFGSLLENYRINLQTVMVDNELLKANGLRFNESYEVSEEYDLFLRLALCTKTHYLEPPLAEYRIHDDMLSNRKVALYAVENAQILECLEHEAHEKGFVCENSFKVAKAKLAYYKARALMGENKPKEARTELSPVVLMGWRYMAVYVMTFFGVGIWKKLHRSFGRYA